MNVSSPPLLETRDLVLGGETPIEFGSLTISASSLSLWNEASALLRALEDESLIAEGGLLLLGQQPATLLASGTAAYVPRQLPLAENTKVKEAIVLSGRLLGLKTSDAEYALSRCRMLAHEKKRLAELSRLQTRLVCLAHGLCGNPELLLLENLYADLDDGDAAVIEALLDVELEDRSFIVATSSRDPASRSLALRTEKALTTAGNQALPPADPKTLPAEGYWVCCGADATSLAARLTEHGAQVSRSPRSSVLLVRRASGSLVYRCAQELGVSITEITPAGSNEDLT